MYDGSGGLQPFAACIGSRSHATWGCIFALPSRATLNPFTDLLERIANLPRDGRGFPVPWFVAWFDGRPDFRVVHTPRYGQAWNGELCWVCGQKLGAFRAWVMGPVSLLEGATPEPPCHLECGQFAARSCPHLANPQMRRKPKNLPARAPTAGVPVMERSGVTAIWITKGRGAQPFRAPHGVMFKLDPPSGVEWYVTGRLAARDEAQSGLFAALQFLREAAVEGGRALQLDLERRAAAAERWLPAI